jgi:hypothetical protein
MKCKRKRLLSYASLQYINLYQHTFLGQAHGNDTRSYSFLTKYEKYVKMFILDITEF